MNNVNILTAPIYALFSKAFYRQVSKTSLGNGFLYLLYLAALLTVFFYIMIFTVALPQLNPLVAWVEQNMPPLAGTPQGFQMSVPSPYVMVHPDFGPLVTFDMNVTEADEKMMENVPVLISSTKIYIRSKAGEIRTIDLFSPAAQTRGAQIPKTIQIDGALIEKIYQTLKTWILGFLFFILLLVFFLMNLVQGLLCSLLGLIFNSMRSAKLGYGAVLNVSLFALTPAVLYSVFKEVVPFLRFLPSGFLVSLLITGIYLFLFLKEDAAEKTA